MRPGWCRSSAPSSELTHKTIYLGNPPDDLLQRLKAEPEVSKASEGPEVRWHR